MTTKYIARDTYGWALSFLGNGECIQCDDENADVFDTMEEALAALRRADGPNGGGDVDVLE